MISCPYCSGGRVPAGWNYPSHVCPDCDGIGQLAEKGIDYDECEDCGEKIDAGERFCWECQEKHDVMNQGNDGKDKTA